MKIHQFSGLPNARVSFCIYGDSLNPKEITEFINLVPSHTHSKGDYPKNNPKYAAYKQGAWIIHSQQADTKTLENHLEGLLALLLPHKKFLLGLPHDFLFRFYCVLYNPHAFNLPVHVLTHIAEIKAEFGVTFENLRT